jgi:hypothetical protein
MAATLKFGDILQVLSRNGVEFILVGGIAAILEGAPVSTFDLDVVIRRTEGPAKRVERAQCVRTGRPRYTRAPHQARSTARLDAAPRGSRRSL